MKPIARVLMFVLLASAVLAPLPVIADVLGANVPAPSLTAERIAALPANQRAAWEAYLQRSHTLMAGDKSALASERNGLAAPPAPPTPSEGHINMPLDRDGAWYATPEARAIADNIVSFQTPAGGWGKNQNRAGPPRVRGQSYVIEERHVDPGSGNFDTPLDPSWHYVGTLDNDATTTEIRFLARVAARTPDHAGDAYRAGVVKGVRYLLAAQYPNGGWPQVYPLEGGYHDCITFNDDAVSDVSTLLDDIAQGGDYAFVPVDLRTQAAMSARHAVDVILASQVLVQGHKTIWAQQEDMLTLAPASARNYEMPALSSSESGDILVFLMQQPHPSPAIKAAVHDGIEWLRTHPITGQAFTMTPQGRQLVAQPGAGPIWSRYYDIATGRPIFGDRDRSIHDNVNDISLERRNGYSWYNATPQHALTAYEAWNRANP